MTGNILLDKPIIENQKIIDEFVKEYFSKKEKEIKNTEGGNEGIISRMLNDRHRNRVDQRREADRDTNPSHTSSNHHWVRDAGRFRAVYVLGLPNQSESLYETAHHAHARGKSRRWQLLNRACMLHIFPTTRRNGAGCWIEALIYTITHA